MLLVLAIFFPNQGLFTMNGSNISASVWESPVPPVLQFVLGCWGTLWLCWSWYVTPHPTDGTRSTSWWRGWRWQTAGESCFSTLPFWPDMPQISRSISAAFCAVILPSLHRLLSYLLLWSSARCPLTGVWRCTGHSTTRASTATGGGWWRWLGLSGR